MLKSKIHRATVTGTDLGYEGSITIDSRLLEQADMLPYEQVHVLNCSTGSRCITYTIPSPPGSGMVVLNGPAARLGSTGDQVIVLSYCELSGDELSTFSHTVLMVDNENHVVDAR
jgi:aspartate 1-decarboxylase